MNSETIVENEAYSLDFSPQHTYYDFDGNMVFSFKYSIIVYKVVLPYIGYYHSAGGRTE